MKKIINAPENYTDDMARLRERKIPFGISNCYTSKNYNVIGSEEYFDQMIEWGAKYAWPAAIRGMTWKCFRLPAFP